MLVLIILRPSRLLIPVAVLLLQYLALCRLWVPEVHHLIKQFVDNDEVVANTLLLQHLEVFREDLHDLVKEEKDFGRIGVLFGQREDVEVTVADVEVLKKGPIEDQHAHSKNIRHVNCTSLRIP